MEGAQHLAENAVENPFVYIIVFVIGGPMYGIWARNKEDLREIWSKIDSSLKFAIEFFLFSMFAVTNISLDVAVLVRWDDLSYSRINDYMFWILVSATGFGIGSIGFMGSYFYALYKSLKIQPNSDEIVEKANQFKIWARALRLIENYPSAFVGVIILSERELTCSCTTLVRINFIVTIYSAGLALASFVNGLLATLDRQFGLGKLLLLAFFFCCDFYMRMIPIIIMIRRPRIQAILQVIFIMHCFLFTMDLVQKCRCVRLYCASSVFLPVVKIPYGKNRMLLKIKFYSWSFLQSLCISLISWLMPRPEFLFLKPKSSRYTLWVVPNCYLFDAIIRWTVISGLAFWFLLEENKWNEAGTWFFVMTIVAILGHIAGVFWVYFCVLRLMYNQKITAIKYIQKNDWDFTFGKAEIMSGTQSYFESTREETEMTNLEEETSAQFWTPSVNVIDVAGIPAIDDSLSTQESIDLHSKHLYIPNADLSNIWIEASVQEALEQQTETVQRRSDEDWIDLSISRIYFIGKVLFILSLILTPIVWIVDFFCCFLSWDISLRKLCCDRDNCENNVFSDEFNYGIDPGEGDDDGC